MRWYTNLTEEELGGHLPAFYGPAQSLTVFSSSLPNIPMHSNLDYRGKTVGVQFDLPNGIRVSILWGDRDSYSGAYSNIARKGYRLRDPDATFELAAFWPDGEFVKLAPYDDVVGYIDRDEIRDIVHCLAALDPVRDRNLRPPICGEPLSA